MAPLELTRRQWLLSTLGAAIAGCRAGGGRRPVLPGGFVGPLVERGHLIRQGLQAAAVAPEQADVVIIGAGVAGLSAAWALRRAGFEDFQVLELEDHPGGTSCFGTNAVSPHPWGAHYLPVPSQEQGAVCTLLSELGVLTGFDAAGRAVCGEEHLCRSPQERIFYKGRWYEGLYLRAGASAEDLRQWDRFHDEIGRWARLRSADGRRAFTLPQRLGDRHEAADLHGITMAAALDRAGFTSARLRWQVDYGCRDDFGLTMRETSAWAGIHYYASRLLHPDDHPPEVLTWPAGNGWLVERLAAPLGDRLRTGCAVLDVQPDGDGVLVRGLRLGPAESGGQAGVPMALRARQVIFALPAFLRRHLIAPWRAAPPEWLGRFSYSPWLVANLTLRRAPEPPVPFGPRRLHRTEVPGYPLCWDNVLYESPSLGYVVATHQREPGPAADGVPRTVWTYYLPLCGGASPAAERQRLLDTPFPAWCDFILADLSRAEPELAAQVERIDIYRWGHAMVRPVPALITGDALERAAEPLGQGPGPGEGTIHFAHTDLSGMALFEEAQYAGVQAAQQVLSGRRHGFEPL